jgi:hypothetical protein
MIKVMEKIDKIAIRDGSPGVHQFDGMTIG